MFKEKYLWHIFIASLCIAVLIPLANIFLIFPSFKALEVEEFDEEAMRVARHLLTQSIDQKGKLKDRAGLDAALRDSLNEFELIKLRVFQSDGEIVYSSEASEIGTVNNKPYFTGIVAKGKTYTKIVQKDMKTMEGVTSQGDVVETYVPIMSAGKFMGAFELYYDVTARLKRMNDAVFGYSVLPVAGMAAFLALVTFLLFRVNEQIADIKTKEAELIQSRDSLERTVEERTVELRSANETLEIEILEHRSAEMALKASERFLSTIFDSIYDPFAIFDRNMAIVRANSAYSKLKAVPLVDLIGRQCFEVLEERTDICEDCVVKRSILSADPCSKEKEIEREDGTKAWIEIFTYPIFDDEGRVSHIIEYTRDITGRIMAEHDRKKLIGELEHLSRTDGLTGILNRRTVELYLENEVNRSRRYNSPLAVIICDMDNFKEINDTYGHSEGDKVLKTLTETITRGLRTSDVLGRYGGDEFLIVLPETDLKGALEMAERTKSNIAKTRLQLPGKAKFDLTMSIGISILSPWMQNASDLVNAADKALYASKAAGKDRITVDPDLAGNA